MGVYGQRSIGVLLIDTERLDRRWQAVLRQVPLAIIAGVIVLQTFTASRELELDARALGLGAAIVCAWRKLPMLVTVLFAAAVTAGWRQLQ